MKRVIILLCGLVFCLFTTAAIADEGMWLFNNFPKDKVKAKYGVDVSQEWLDHLRLSSVRFNNGGSGSFVSSDGLTFTNHHVAAKCIEELSRGGKDYMQLGFYAHSQAEEARCPNLELNQLVGIEDVTAKVKDVVQSGMSAAQAGQAERAAMSGIEKECSATSSLRCDVVTLYAGELYQLYKYKKFTDVRLVFAPEFDTAFFGGDPDNFTYPRYDLDVTFFRVYENDKPAHLDNYLHWSPTGIKDKDVVFVAGNPGRTERLKTIAQLQFLRDVDYPARLDTSQRRIVALEKFSAASPENARIAKHDLFRYQNSKKAVAGYEAALKDAKLMARKMAAEQKARDEAASNGKLKAEGGDPWQAIAHAEDTYRENYLLLSYIEHLRGFDSQLAQFARDLVRGASQRSLPNGQRLREYRESALPSLEQNLFSNAPIYKALETAKLTDSFQQMDEDLSSDTAEVMKVLNFRKPAEVAKELIEGTRLDDVEVRKQLWAGGEPAIEASKDPLIVAMREIEPDALEVRHRYEDQVESVEKREGGEIVRLRFSSSGFTEPPDATFTLRLSYGQVKGYEERGKAVPYFTTIAGAYTHAAAHGNKPPFKLPSSWVKAKSKVKLTTPLDFVSTPDIIGGNSGSPTVDRQGDLVGIIFDGNLQSLRWAVEYDDQQGRSISVDTRAIQEALRNIYGATRLADELAAHGGSSAHD